MEKRRSELGRQRVGAEVTQGRACCERWPVVYASKMALIGETQHAFIEFEGQIHVDAIQRLICAAKEFVDAAKPDELAIEAEVQFEQAAIEGEEEVFAVAGGIQDATTAGKFSDFGGRLWLGGDGMKDVDATDAATANERAQASRYRFDFGKFRHVNSVAQGFRVSVCFLTLASAASLKGP